MFKVIPDKDAGTYPSVLDTDKELMIKVIPDKDAGTYPSVLDTAKELMFKVIPDKDAGTYPSVLNMLERDHRMELRPERFRDAAELFDMIVTVEERVCDVVLECLENRDGK